MALDFPSAGLTVGQVFSSAGNSWTWDGTKWVSSAASGGYLPLIGGTITGTAPGYLKVNRNAVTTTPAPGTLPVIYAIGGDNEATIATLDAIGTAAPAIWLRRAKGIGSGLTGLVASDSIGTLVWRGYGATAFSTAGRVTINTIASENWDDTHQGAYAIISATPTGGTATAAVATFQSGVQIGAPTGADKGAGTLNAVSVYANNVLLTSDIALKRDITPLPQDCLAIVGAIEPKRFKFIDPGPVPAITEDGSPTPSGPPGWFDKTRWGFVAQDVERAMQGQDYDGVETDQNDIRSLDYNSMIAVLWKAVQELTAEVKELRAHQPA